jgi:hypothetical protein
LPQSHEPVSRQAGILNLTNFNVLIHNFLCNLPAAGRIGALEFWWQIFFSDFSEQAQISVCQFKESNVFNSNFTTAF